MNSAATAYARQPSTKPAKRWHSIIGDSLSEPMASDLGWFLVNLEDLSTKRPDGFKTAWGTVYNADLRGRTLGRKNEPCSEDTIARLWKHAEEGADPWLKRIQTKDACGHVTGRIGFVWYKRLTDRPVATPDTFGQAEAELRAALGDKKAAPRTLPFRPAQPETPRRFAGQPPADQRGNPPQICDGPISNHARDGIQDEEIEKTTTKPESSSSLASLPGSQEPESPPIPSASALAPATRIAADACTQAVDGDSPVLTVRVPELVAEPGVDQAMLAIFVTRLVAISAGFKRAPNWTREVARNAILALIRFAGCPLWWVGKALDEAEHRPKAKFGNKPVESWGFIRTIVVNWSKGDGSPGEPPALKPPPISSRPPDQDRNKSPASAPREQLVDEPRIKLRDLMRQTEGFDPAALERGDAAQAKFLARGSSNGP